MLRLVECKLFRQWFVLFYPEDTTSRLQLEFCGEMAGQASDMDGVSRDTVGKVEAINATVAPAVLAAVNSGEISINLASQVAVSAPMPCGR